MKNNKWWERLARVVILGLTIGAVAMSIFMISNNVVKKSTYSFESDYIYKNKKENLVKYIESTEPKYNELLAIKEYLGRVGKSRVIKQYLDFYPDKISDEYKGWGDVILELKGQRIRDDLIFDELMKTEIASDLRVKEWDSVEVIYFLWLLLPVLVYFGLGLFYKKVLLYIVFGDNNK